MAEGKEKICKGKGRYIENTKIENLFHKSIMQELNLKFPIVVIGEFEFGKTKVGKIIQKKLSKEYPDLKIKYLNWDDIILEMKLRECYQLRNPFSTLYMQSDVIVMENIQHLKKKTEIQNQLVQILEFLGEMNKFIVITLEKQSDILMLTEALQNILNKGQLVYTKSLDRESRRDYFKRMNEIYQKEAPKVWEQTFQNGETILYNNQNEMLFTEQKRENVI